VPNESMREKAAWLLKLQAGARAQGGDNPAVPAAAQPPQQDTSLRAAFRQKTIELLRATYGPSRPEGQ
jgi:hypothetical protein